MAMTRPGMSPDGVGSAERGAGELPCGRDPLEVLDRAGEHRSTAHELSCPYCQEVLAADAPAVVATQALAQAEDDVEVPNTLLPNVMRTVWSELRRNTLLPIPTPRGNAFVAQHAVVAVIERVLEDTTDLQVHTCTVEMAAPESDGADVTPAASAASPVENGASAAISIRVTAAAAYNTDVPAVAARARDLVRSAVVSQFGWRPDVIDIDIVDIYLHEDAPR